MKQRDDINVFERNNNTSFVYDVKTINEFFQLFEKNLNLIIDKKIENIVYMLYRSILETKKSNFDISILLSFFVIENVLSNMWDNALIERDLYKKLKDDMERICYIDNFNLNDVNKIFENFNIFNEKNALDLLKNECVDNKRIKELDLEKDFDGFIEILNTIFSTSRTAMNILINLYEEYDEKGMFSDLTLFNDLKTIITTNKEFKVLETDKSEQTSLQLSKLLIDDYENSYKVFDYFNLFKVYQKKLVKKTNNHKFNALKKISAYEEAKKALTSPKDALPTNELTLINPDIAFEIIKYKSNKLEKEYREEKELYEINNNEITPLNEALYKYGIHFFTYEEKKKILDNISLNDINLLLSILDSSKMKFLLSDKNTLLEIMYSSNLSIISNINDLINNKIINESFVEKNIGILFNKECSILENIIPKYMDFSKNLQAHS